MTNLEYLKDTYKFQSEAEVIEIKETEKGLAVILDSTIFYPQGGGQPADQGVIETENAKYNVTDVRMDEEGLVYHFGEYEKGELKEGDKVLLKIDEERRIKNAKLHSAGHLIDVAVEKAELYELTPVKGFHFPDGPYIEYEGSIEDPESYIPKIEKALEELITENIEIEKTDLTCEEARRKGIKAPPGKTVRAVNYAGYDGCGCGGTHLNRSGELGKITIRKISSKKGKTRIAYVVS